MNIIADGGGNTRLKPITSLDAHIDYLRVKVEKHTPEQFDRFLSFLDSRHLLKVGSPWSLGGNTTYYEHKVIGINGLKGGFNVDSDGCISATVDLSGAYFEPLNRIDQWRLIQGLGHTYKADCSRIDLAIDDYTFSVIPVSNMRESWEQGNNFGFRNHKYVESGDTPETLKKTWYFGSRESGKLTRIYNHDEECMRHEVEFKRRYARVVFERILSLDRTHDISVEGLHPCNEFGDSLDINSSFDQELYECMSSLVLGAIDFRDRGSRKDSGRVGCRDSVRLSFYQEYIDKVGSTLSKIRLPKVPKSIQKTKNWIVRNVLPTLAMIKRGLSSSEFYVWMLEGVAKGEEKLNREKLLWAEEIKQNPCLIQIN